MGGLFLSYKPHFLVVSVAFPLLMLLLYSLFR